MDNLKCSSYLNRVRYDVFSNKLNVVLTSGADLNVIDFKNMINKYNTDNIYIMNITSLHNLENVLKTIKIVNTNKNIIIDLCTPDLNGQYKYPPMILKLENRERIDLSNIPGNVKIHAFTIDNNQTEFTTWTHNLSIDNKTLLYNVLTSEDQKIFIKQEKIIKELIEKICEENPNILNLSKKDQFEFIFSFIKEYIKEKRRGVLFEEANLLTLITNNNYLRLNVSTVLGKYKSSNHAWNEYIDNGIIYEYDLINNIKSITTFKDMEDRGYTYDRVYSKVIEIKQKNNEIKNVSHFNHPLPKTKKNTLIRGKNKA